MRQTGYIGKKAGIITLYHGNYNFGGLLQAYALPKILEQQFGFEAEQIDYVPSVSTQNKEPEHEKNNSLFKAFYQVLYRVGVFFFSTVYKKKLNYRKQMFKQFLDEIPHSKTAYDFNSIDQCLPQYQMFLCGGDQIWNDYGEHHNIRIYTLQFVPPGMKKIAYAPSMAVLRTTQEFERIMQEGLNSLDAISVRERRTVPVLCTITDRNIEVVVDPVLLMTTKDWEEEIKTPLKRGRYILCYFLGDNTACRIAAEKFARRVGLPIVTFPHIFCNVVRKCDLFFGDICDYTSGPREFIGLIRNADFVITDSFHACVFSMIFQTPFVILERSRPEERENMNSRIYDFLEEYHLATQLVTENELADLDGIPTVDFTYAHEYWKKRREESLEYLKNALEDNWNGAAL